MENSTISFMPQVDSEKPLFAPQSIPVPSYEGDYKPMVAKKSIPLIFLVLSTVIFQFYIRPKLVAAIPQRTQLYGVEVFFAAVIIIIYSILVPLCGGPILNK